MFDNPLLLQALHTRKHHQGYNMTCSIGHLETHIPGTSLLLALNTMYIYRNMGQDKSINHSSIPFPHYLHRSCRHIHSFPTHPYASVQYSRCMLRVPETRLCSLKCHKESVIISMFRILRQSLSCRSSDSGSCRIRLQSCLDQGNPSTHTPLHCKGNFSRIGWGHLTFADNLGS